MYTVDLKGLDISGGCSAILYIEANSYDSVLLHTKPLLEKINSTLKGKNLLSGIGSAFLIE